MSNGSSFIGTCGTTITAESSSATFTGAAGTTAVAGASVATLTGISASTIALASGVTVTGVSVSTILGSGATVNDHAFSGSMNGGSAFGDWTFGSSAFGESTFGGVADEIPDTDPVNYDDLEPGSYDNEPATGTFIDTSSLIVTYDHTSISPPEWGAKLIDMILWPDDADNALANLGEAYERRVQKEGRKYADVWYWVQVVHIVLVSILSLVDRARGKA